MMLVERAPSLDQASSRHNYVSETALPAMGINTKQSKAAAKFAKINKPSLLPALSLPALKPKAVLSDIDPSRLNITYSAIIPVEAQEVHDWALSVFQTVKHSNDSQLSPDDKEKMTPALTNSEGINGSYFIRQKVENDWRIVGIFKPADEAVGAPNALKVGDIIASKYGIQPGEEAKREVIAYILGQALGVPPTVMLTLGSPVFVRRTENTPPNKPGSLQKFVPNSRNFNDVSTQELPKILKGISESETHRIAMIDLRMGNTDRNKGNLLFTTNADGAVTLYPIDHGCIISQKFVDGSSPCWSGFPGSDTPFTEQEKDDINSIDIEKDILEVRKAFPDFSVEDEHTLRISTMILQEGVKQNLSPLGILALYSKPDEFSLTVANQIYTDAEGKSSSKDEFITAAQQNVETAVAKMKEYVGNGSDVYMATQMLCTGRLVF